MVLVDGAHVDAGGILIAAGEVSGNNPTGQQSLRRKNVNRMLRFSPLKIPDFRREKKEHILSHSSDRGNMLLVFLWISGNHLM